MLSQEKILKNAKKFNDTGVKYEVINDDLMNMLGQEFINAPCTTTTNFYGAYDGGLIQHILNTTKYALKINENLPEIKQVNNGSIIRTCLIHQIGKAKMYSEQTSQWHKDNRGEMYTFNDELLSMSTAQRSVYYALKAGINLTEDEVFAIYNYNSDFAQRPMTTLGEKLAALLRTANMVAIIEEK
jgi:hypothetical protein|tara:strand:+ start:1247 stop:1801 length:555 start_codon:yes stop_codon:yes gene_type:complete